MQEGELDMGKEDILRGCYTCFLMDDADQLQQIISSSSLDIETKKDLLLRALIDRRMNCFRFLVSRPELSEAKWNNYNATSPIYTIADMIQRDCSQEEVDRYLSLLNVCSQPEVTSHRQMTSLRPLHLLVQTIETAILVADADNKEVYKDLWFSAAREGNVEWLEFLAAGYINVDILNNQQETALQLVALRNCSKCVKLLLDKGAGITKALVKYKTMPGRWSPSGMPSRLSSCSPLVLACSVDQENAQNRYVEGLRIKYLDTLQNSFEADQNKYVENSYKNARKNKFDNTQANTDERKLTNNENARKTNKVNNQYKIKENAQTKVVDAQLQCVKLLLNPTRQLLTQEEFAEELFEALFYACIHARNVNIVRYLISEGADVNYMPDRLESKRSLLCLVLEQKICSKRNELIRTLLEADIRLDVGAETSPLHCCSYVDDLDALCQYDLDPNSQNQKGDTPLMLFVRQKHAYRLVVKLIEESRRQRKRIDMNSCDNYGMSVLKKAIYREVSPNTVRCLLREGAAVFKLVNFQKVSHQLLYIVYNRGQAIHHEPYKTLVKELVRFGSDVMTVSCSGQLLNPLAVAVQWCLPGQSAAARIMLLSLASHSDIQELHERCSPHKLRHAFPAGHFTLLLANPYTLKHLVRNRIRKQMGDIRDLDRLPLPHELKGYLWFSEFSFM